MDKEKIERLSAIKAHMVDSEARLSAHAIGVLKSGQLPTPDDVAAFLTWRVGETRQSVLRHHAFWHEHRLRTGFDALIASALAAHADLCRCDATLTAFAVRRERFERHVEHTVENPAQKEVMAFCAAYVGTIDTLRRIRSARPDIVAEIDRVRIEATSAPEFRFVFELRKNLSHGSVSVPGWSTRSDENGSSGAMKFNIKELLAFGSWTADTKAYLTGRGQDDLAIASVISTCAEGLVAFQRELKLLYYRHPTAEETDFHRLEDLHGRTSSRQFIKIIMQPHLGKPGNPYRFLPYFFEENEIREIMRRPPNSIEQVELMIALKAARIDCDDDLRQKLYQFFDVPKPGSATD